MVLTICREYSGLPDVRTLSHSEICFFYRGIAADLMERGRLADGGSQ